MANIFSSAIDKLNQLLRFDQIKCELRFLFCSGHENKIVFIAEMWLQ